MLKDKEAQPLPAAFIVNDVQFQRRKWGYPQTAHSCNQEIFLRKTQKLFLTLTDTGLTESCLKRGLQNHLGSLWWTSKLLIFICEKGVPLNKQQKHEVASSFFLGNIWKRIQGTHGYTLELVLLSSGGGWSKSAVCTRPNTSRWLCCMMAVKCVEILDRNFVQFWTEASLVLFLCNDANCVESICF